MNMTDSYGGFFYFTLCHFCKDSSEQNKRCSSCKTVAYCSKAHQISDWKSHKDLCKAITCTSKHFKIGGNFSFEEWKHYRLAYQTAWSIKLKRQLRPVECQMWMFPPMCNVCYGRENLTIICKCLNIAYCSKTHMEQDRVLHAPFCDELKLCMDIDKHLAKVKLYPQIKIQETFINKGFPEDIYKLIDLIEQKPNLGIKNDKLVLEQVLKTDLLAPGAIIVYALKMSLTDKPQLKSKNKLIIHIVGSSMAEGTADWQLVTELIFHWLENLEEVCYVFIGPEAWDMSSNSLELCDLCEKNGKKVKLKVYAKLYHEIVGRIEQPDLILSFNSGLHEFEEQKSDDWKKTIPLLVKAPEVPFIFTSYTKEEMGKDLDRLKKVSGWDLVILYSGKNRYGSRRPVRDWCTKDIPVFYSSGYICIIKRATTPL